METLKGGTTGVCPGYAVIQVYFPLGMVMCTWAGEHDEDSYLDLSVAVLCWKRFAR